MLFKFRKIAILALCLVLVCGISAAAFAATPPSGSVTYSDGSFSEYFTRISRYATDGAIIVESEYGSGNTSAYMTYLYIDADLNQVSSSCGDVGRDYATVSVSDPTMFAMVEATYEFEAGIPTSFGYQYFNPDPVHREF